MRVSVAHVHVLFVVVVVSVLLGLFGGVLGAGTVALAVTLIACGRGPGVV